MPTEMHLGEAVTLGFAALTLLATVAIALIAAHLSSDFTDLRRGIKELEERLDEANNTEGRFRFESEMLVRLAGNLYKNNALLLAFFRKQSEVGGSSFGDADQKAAYETLVMSLRNAIRRS